jgi:hypothetical protein
VSYAIDLTARQSSRVIEQALRHKAAVILEPRIFNAEEALRGHLEAVLPPGGSALRPAALVVALTTRCLTDVSDLPQPVTVTLQELNLLVGTCCDGSLRLGDSRYLFDADVLRVEASHEPGMIARVYMTRPETLQVMQRRKFSRFRPARSTQVELRWQKDSDTMQGAIAWLCNISPDGLACRLDRRIAEQLWIGDRLSAEFTLAPGERNHYVIEAILCSKTPAGTDDKMILGLQYVTGPGSEETLSAANALREHLQSRLGVAAHQPKGADA